MKLHDVSSKIPEFTDDQKRSILRLSHAANDKRFKIIEGTTEKIRVWYLGKWNTQYLNQWKVIDDTTTNLADFAELIFVNE